MRAATIADLRDGEEATVSGTIEAAGPLIDGPSGEPCVYWEKRERMGSDASARGGERFWVVDEDERVLVPADELTTLSAAGDWTREVVAIATTEISAVAAELSDIKQRLRRLDSPALRRRRRKLAKVATLLCSIKAHARGKVHGNGTLESQERWIEKNRHLAGDGPGKATIEKAVTRLLVVLEPGDPVTVSGHFRMEPMPAGLGSGGGYRDRPTCWVVRGASVLGREELHVGATLPSPTEPRPRPTQPSAIDPESSESTGGDRTFERSVLVGVTALAAIGAVLTLLRDC